MNLDEIYDYRTEVVDTVVSDLTGPTDGEDEEIVDRPLTRYIAGILYPQSTDPVSAEIDTDIADEDELSGVSDPPVALANVRYPSSMGLTFTVDATVAGSFSVHCEAAAYHEIAGAEGSQVRWKRRSIEIPDITVDVTLPVLDRRYSLAPGLELFCRVRPAQQDRIPITLVLLNTQSVGPTGGLRDAESFLQTRIAVSSAAPETAIFADRSPAGAFGDDEDLRSYRLLYRHSRTYAVGHGCSVDWVEDPRRSRASILSTTFAPRYELLLADSNPAIVSDALSMRFLAGGQKAEVLDALKDLPRQYEDWLAQRENDLADLSGEFASTGRDHLDNVMEACRRVADGIALLEDDDRTWQAFRLANDVMLRVRARTTWLAAGAIGECPITGAEHRWRPFQLAFILLCLRGLADVDSADRAVADLLWFPTGGGKTEAYFGLIAFVIFRRRLQWPGQAGNGVAALMRYTLRLLTIQQFERASLLICTCDSVRREQPGALGSEPISIGLWVGQGGTPNSLDEARASLRKLRLNPATPLEEKNPVQLHSCPWCGTSLDHMNYWVADHVRPGLTIQCRTDGCAFKDAIPVYVVDEDIYTVRPSLVIATADKFAALPWNEKVGELFNMVSTQSRRPELIIQDELHLISGPLGTVAGLYETAIDDLCTQDGRRPKVIASTATIRRAAGQGAGLFNREVRQFPPPGLDARDSFFAVETSRDSRGTRMYLGLMAPGTSHATLMINTYAALLEASSFLAVSDELKDVYWTLIGYFNSLRVLGGARMQVQDDVPDRMELLAEYWDAQPARRIENRIELTSREPSGNIPAHLRQMAVEHPSPEALDVILATNMISVGVDVNRLGLMVVMGQPQSTSEYIQATSRVGRQLPGLVVVLFNSARSRDKSHYESFRTFHSALYRQVESTSVTPFSARARDRGLHAVVIALARHLVTGFRGNSQAGRILTHRGDLAVVKETIMNRVLSVASDEAAATSEQIDRVFEEWSARAQECGDLVYSSAREPEKALLREATGLADEEANGFATLRSLRDVDRSSNLYLVQG